MSDEIDKIFSGMNKSLDSVLLEPMSIHGRILHTLKMELKLSVNSMVQNKPDNWKILKSVYVDVLKMISEIEAEV